MQTTVVMLAEGGHIKAVGFSSPVAVVVINVGPGTMEAALSTMRETARQVFTEEDLLEILGKQK